MQINLTTFFSEDAIPETLCGHLLELNENIPKEKEWMIIICHANNIVSVKGKMVDTVKLRVL